MARQGKGILGAPSKSVGMITGQKHSGKDTIRSKPKPSIKTQTPELTRTKSDFQIALSVYNRNLNSGAGYLFERNMKGKTAKNHFIGLIIKLLTVKEDTIFNLALFPDSIPYDRMRPYASTPGNRRNWGFWQNQKPLNSLADPNDIRCYWRSNEDTGEDLVSFDGLAGTRGTSQSNNNWRPPVYPSGHRRIYLMFFRGWNNPNVFNAYAIAGNGY